MAKSLRSKRKRKMRAIKRVRYGEKELIKLKHIVDNASINKSICDQFVNTSISKSKPKVIEENISNNENNMDLDLDLNLNEESKEKRSPNKSKQIRDSNGHYPIWMTQRHVRKLKNTKSKRLKSKKKTKV